MYSQHVQFSLTVKLLLLLTAQASIQTLVKPNSWADVSQSLPAVAQPAAHYVPRNTVLRVSESAAVHTVIESRSTSTSPEAYSRVIPLKGRSIRLDIQRGATLIDEQLLAVQHSHGLASSGESGVSVLLHFHDPLSVTQRQRISEVLHDEHGSARLWSFIPPNTVHVLAAPDRIRRLTAMEGLAWAGRFVQGLKYQESIFAAQPSSHASEPSVRALSFAVELHPIVAVAEFIVDHYSGLRQLLDASHMAALQPMGPHRVHLSLLGDVSQDEVTRVVMHLAAREDVVWLEHHIPVAQPANSAATALLQTGAAAQHPTKIHDMGLRGQGRLIGVGDSGVDYHNCLFWDSAAEPNLCKSACKLSDEFAPDCWARFVQDPVHTQCYETVVKCSFAHNDCQPSSHRKLGLYWGFADDKDTINGHGTHVCGSVAGHVSYNVNATAPAIEQYHGMAPEARLVFADLGLSSVPEAIFSPQGLYSSYFPYFYGAGARVMSNSWGALPCQTTNCGSYSLNALDIDHFVFDNQDMVVLFAAANNGQAGFFTLSNEAHNKNGITVGATRTTTDHLLNEVPPYQAFSYFTQLQTLVNSDAFWNSAVSGGGTLCAAFVNYANSASCAEVKAWFRAGFQSAAFCCGLERSTNPLDVLWARAFTSCCASTVRTHFQTDVANGVGDSYTVAYFSGRGPTRDGRLKPDVLAPGDVVVSSRSAGMLQHNQCDTAPSGALGGLLAMSGTSMATPLTAGAAALVQQYFIDGHYPHAPQAGTVLSEPSAALVKAVLINSAVPVMGHLFDDRFSDDLVDMIPQLGYQFSQGHGRIKLDNALQFANDPTSPVLFVADVVGYIGVSVDDPHWFEFIVGPGSTSGVSVTLAWTDAVASPAAHVQLVNDMDLKVYLPDCTVVHGNEYLQLSMLADPESADWAFGLLPQYAPVHGAPVDRVNNVERVYIPTANVMPGRYRVEVSGYMLNFPDGDGVHQSFALVVNYAVNGTTAGPACPAFDYANRTTDLYDYVVRAKVGLDVTPQNVNTLLLALADLLDVAAAERLWFYNVTKDDQGTGQVLTFSIGDAFGGPSVNYEDRNQFSGAYLTSLFESLVSNPHSGLFAGGHGAVLATFKSSPAPSVTVIPHINRQSDSSAPNTMMIAAIAAGSGAAVLVTVALCCWCRRRKRAVGAATADAQLDEESGGRKSRNRSRPVASSQGAAKPLKKSPEAKSASKKIPSASKTELRESLLSSGAGVSDESHEIAVAEVQKPAVREKISSRSDQRALERQSSSSNKRERRPHFKPQASELSLEDEYAAIVANEDDAKERTVRTDEEESSD